jgi:hypothetical protein
MTGLRPSAFYDTKTEKIVAVNYLKILLMSMQDTAGGKKRFERHWLPMVAAA